MFSTTRKVNKCGAKQSFNIGTYAIKENRTAVVLAETALMDVTASRKTFAPVMKNHHMSARPARTTAHAVYKRWNTMPSWHSRHTKHFALNPAKAFRFQKKIYPTLILLFHLKSSAVRPFLRCGIHTKRKMPVSDRTLYTYINSGLLDADNLDLRRKLRMPSRKKSGPVLRVDKQCHIGRSYEDYEAYVAKHPDAAISQMDSVIGRKGGKVLLTILFKNCDLQLMYLRDRNTAASVSTIVKSRKEGALVYYYLDTDDNQMETLLKLVQDINNIMKQLPERREDA